MPDKLPPACIDCPERLKKLVNECRENCGGVEIEDLKKDETLRYEKALLILAKNHGNTISGFTNEVNTKYGYNYCIDSNIGDEIFTKNGILKPGWHQAKYDNKTYFYYEKE